MGISNLSNTSALSSGSELWVIPSKGASPWSNKINWYLNFQLTKASTHKALTRNKELETILQESEIKFSLPEQQENAPLMIASQKLLPCHHVVQVPAENDDYVFVNSSFKIWKKLNKPSLRVFLPENLKESDFVKMWPEPSTPIEISLVHCRHGVG